MKIHLLARYFLYKVQTKCSLRVEKGSQPQNAGKQKWVNVPENTE